MLSVSGDVNLAAGERADRGTPARLEAPSRKVLSLLTKAGYAPPLVASFPIDGMTLSDNFTLAGNA